MTDTGTFLKGIDLFDPVEFGITSKDARSMSVGTRKLIETTFLALLDSGIHYRGANIGAYMSAVAHDMFSISGHVISYPTYYGESAHIGMNRTTLKLVARSPADPVWWQIVYRIIWISAGPAFRSTQHVAQRCTPLILLSRPCATVIVKQRLLADAK